VPTLAKRANVPVLQAYEILDKIGDGGMASVYRARSRTTGELVAVKVPSPAVRDSATLFQRFQEEYRVGNRLCHPALVRSLDLCREGDLCYLVLELVDGPDLGQRIDQDGPLPEAEAVRIVAEIAAGLHEAHRHGVIHRDVKPSNILLSRSGAAKLGDLGLAKDLDNDLGLTQTRKGLGTPNFMAPEQFSDARGAGVACDVYSLGATLYAAVTGTLPFDARGLGGTLRKKMNNQLTPPRELAPSLSERTDRVICRAVQADPRRRQASCQEFIRELTGEAESSPRGRAGVERRRAARHRCTVASVCEVRTSIHEDETAEQDEWQATVQDLSANGLGFVLNRRFEPGTQVRVVVKRPERRAKSDALVAEVIHVKRGRAGTWLVGCRWASPLSDRDLQDVLGKGGG
jgi:serine/threonine protein kinase